MCGIFGVVNFNNSSDLIHENKFTASVNLMQHRGPDDWGIWINTEKKIGLGHRRLSILDISSLGHQPMSDIDNRIKIIFNGEIYNYREIEKKLKDKGYTFRSKSDTEMIIYAYNEWGISCVKKFNGMFSFCIWDDKIKKAFLVRDRLGIKPLYYKFSDSSLCFSSEIKSILNYTGNESLNYNAISSYFSYRYVVGNITLFENIFPLEPGTILEFDFNRSSYKLNKYWDLPKIKSADKDRIGVSAASKKIYNLLKQSVEYRKISDVPIGSYLSGGLDSSIITALMAENEDHKVNTFTIGFEDYNEFEYARMVAEKYNTDHHEVVISADEFWDNNDKMILYKDAPLAVPNETLIYIMSRELKKYFTVVLSGEGADELFGGYGRIFRSPFDYQKFKLFENQKSKLEGMFSSLENKYGTDDAFNSEISFFFKNYNYFPLEAEELFFNTEINSIVINNNYAKDFFTSEYQNLSGLEMYDKFLWIFQKHHLLGLLGRLDASTMAASVEGRVPFVDHKLVEYVNSLPFDYKNKWNDEISVMKSFLLNSDKISEVYDNPKFILRDLFKNKLPEEILKRKKIGFPVPLDKLLDNKNFKRIRETILDGKLLKDGVYNSLKVQNFIKKREKLFKEKHKEAYKLWMMYNLEKFYSIYF